MQDSLLNAAIIKAVERVSQTHSCKDRSLTIADLRVYIREVRMSEIMDWSNHDLDAVEQHAAQLSFSAPLESVFEITPASGEGPNGNRTTWINSPSPFAWT